MPVSYLNIDAEQAGQRIDNFLFRHCKNVPKSHIYRILRSGEVRINKGRIKAPYRLQAGDVLRLPPITINPTQVQRVPKGILAELQQAVLFEDDSLIILNKPSGIAVHGGSGLNFGIIEALRQAYPEQKYLELVHRLDKETSGCLMIAKKPARLRQLHQQLREHQIDKRYYALLKGRWHPRLGKIEQPLLRYLLPSGERRVKVSNEGKAALTYFSLKKAYKSACWVSVQLETGRTHQIRVHAAYCGHPIVGDDKYGHAPFNEQLKKHGFGRLCLHAYQLSIPHYDSKGKALQIQAPLPDDLQTALNTSNF